MPLCSFNDGWAFHVGGCINFRITHQCLAGLANNFKVVIGIWLDAALLHPRFGSRVPNTLITLFTLVCIKVELKENAIILQNSRCYEGTTFSFFFMDNYLRMQFSSREIRSRIRYQMNSRKKPTINDRR